MKVCRSVRKIREMLLLVIVASLTLWGCAPGAPTAALDDDAPAFIDPLPSPTPTWAAPDPDDDDPIVDCVLDAPLCVIDVALIEVAGEAYLGVELQVVSIPGKWQPDGAENILLDANVALQRDGETIAEIDVEGHSVAIVPAQGGIILTEEDGAPLLSINSSELGVLLADPRPSPSLAAAYDPSTQELLLLDAEGNPIATISAGGIGVLLADPRPSPIYHVSSDPTLGGFLILNAEEEPLVLVDASSATVWFLEPTTGDRVVGLVMLNDLVVIAAPAAGPVAIVHPERSGAVGDSIRITRLIPLSLDLQGEFDLSGSLELLAVDKDGKRTLLGKSEVSQKEQVASMVKPIPTPTTSPVGGKQTPTVPSKSTTPPKATATTAPPKPTATSSGGKATPTPGK